MKSILDVDALDFGLGIGNVLTPKSSIQQLQQQSNVLYINIQWLSTINPQKCREAEESIDGMSPVPIFQENMIELDDENGIDDNIQHRNVNNNVKHTEKQTELKETMSC